MASRKLEDLHPVVKKMAEEFLTECEKANIKVQIYMTLRTKEEQDELYAQGRTKPGNKVTNAKGGQSMHNYGLAFDAGPVVDGKIAWNNAVLFDKMGRIGKKVGLKWGGDFKNFPDKPHFEWTGGLSLADLQAGKKPKVVA